MAEPASRDNEVTIVRGDPHCALCFRFPLFPVTICSDHLEQSGIPEFERSHPLVDGERPCTHTCGCISLEELERRLATEPAPPSAPGAASTEPASD